MRAGVERSLRRLRTDHLDLVQFHGSPSRAMLEQERAVEELEALRAAGAIRFVGMSAQLPHLRDHVAMGVFDAFQIPYSAVERDHEEVIAAASATGAAIIVRGVVARGSLADRVDRPAESLRGAVQQGLVLWDDHDVDELLDGASRTEFLVRFAITHPSVQCALVGTVDPQHLADDLAAAAKGPLPADVYDEARRRLDPTGARPLDSVRSVSALPDQSPDRTRQVARRLQGLVSRLSRPPRSDGSEP